MYLYSYIYIFSLYNKNSCPKRTYMNYEASVCIRIEDLYSLLYGNSTTDKSDTKTLRIVTLPY